MTDEARSASEVSAALHDLLLEDRELTGFLEDLARLSAEHLSGKHPVYCGITLRRQKRNAVVASSSAEAQRMDETQAGFDEGPCLDAQRHDTVIRVPDVAYEARWPTYMGVVRDHGLHSILAVPLRAEGSARAALNLYTRRPGAFDAEEVAAAETYAWMASRVLQIALRIAASAEEAEHRRAAMETRTPIDMAVGVIMAQNRCDQQEAFEILQRASSRRNLKLSALAEELLASIGQQAPTTAFDP